MLERAEQATAASGGSRELAKGRNKENFDSEQRRKTTIFLTAKQRENQVETNFFKTLGKIFTFIEFC